MNIQQSVRVSIPAAKIPENIISAKIPLIMTPENVKYVGIHLKNI